MARPVLEIARREFLEHVLSWRFLIAFALSTLVLTTSVVALAAAYREDLDAFNVAQDDLRKSDNSFSTTLLEVNRWLARPNVLSIFVGGAGDAYRSIASGPEFALGGGSPSYTPESGSGSPTNTRFDVLDVGFVAVVVMTFMAVIFSFDAVSGEKERGTLKLLLANPVPKDAVLLGKYLGGMASITLPFLISLVIALAVLAFTGVGIPPGAWARLGVILAAALLLLSAFYLVGLLVSSLCRRSATSLLAMALVWLVLVFAVGNVAAVVAKGTTDAMPTAELQSRQATIEERTFSEVQALQEELFSLFQKQTRGNLTDAERARLAELQQEIERIVDEGSEERRALAETASRQLDSQLQRAEAIAALSPAEAFRSLATAVARSDYWTYRDVADAAEQYQREVERAREEWQEENGAQGPGGARVAVFVGGGGVRTLGDDFEPPTFEYEPASLGEQLGSARGVRDLLSLLGYNLAAFAAAYVAFLRYDVR